MSSSIASVELVVQPSIGSAFILVLPKQTTALSDARKILRRIDAKRIAEHEYAAQKRPTY